MNQKVSHQERHCVLLNPEDYSSDVPTLQEFELWVQQVIDECDQFFQVSIEIVSSQFSQQLNNQYRNKDKPTNVLSFPLELPEEVEEDLVGDLAICADIVKVEAQEQNKPIKDHWAHMTIHGTLHLLGYDHIEDHEAEEMESLEIKLLQQLNIENPYEAKV